MYFGQQFQYYLNNEAELNEKEVLEADWRRISFQSFIIFILIGIPIWWIATTPYRAKLPQIEPSILQTLKQDLELIQTNLTIDDGIWDNLGHSTDYNLHFIFIHNSTANVIDEINASKIILNKINAFSQKYFQPIGIKLAFSSEHIWDFNLADFLFTNFGSASNINFLDENIASSISTELDKISSPPVGKETLLKISIFFNAIDNKQNDGIAIASWGGLFFHNNNENESIESLLNSIMANLQLQFSIPPIKIKDGKMETLEMALKLHQQRICLKNMLQTVQMLNSLHQLASKIEDLVISDEVAQFAEQSSNQFFKAYNSFKQNGIFDSESAAQACRLAEFANGHYSLLELLNFPSDQKYGIYVPLFLPILAPIFQPLTLFFLFLIAKFREMKKRRKQEGKKNDDKND